MRACTMHTSSLWILKENKVEKGNSLPCFFDKAYNGKIGDSGDGFLKKDN